MTVEIFSNILWCQCPHWHSTSLFTTSAIACLQPGGFLLSLGTLCNSLPSLPLNWRVSTETLFPLQAPMWLICSPEDSHRAITPSACSHYLLLVTNALPALQSVASLWLRDFRAALASLGKPANFFAIQYTELNEKNLQ